VQVVWEEMLPGPNKFKEVETNLPHSRDRCDAAKTGGLGKYSPQGQKEFVEQYRPEQKPQQQKSDDYIPGDIMAILKIVETLDQKVDKIMTLVQTINDGINAYLNEPTVVENRILKAKVNELEDIERQRTKEKDFVPANQVKSEERPHPDITPGTAPNPIRLDVDLTDKHVQDMVRKGETEEDLDLT